MKDKLSRREAIGLGLGTAMAAATVKLAAAAGSQSSSERQEGNQMTNLSEYNRYGEDLERQLLLRTSPIAVKMLGKEADMPEGAVSEAVVLQMAEGAIAHSRANLAVAVSGVVLCKVDAGYRSIRPTDLLTTSPTPGHAMRSDDAVPGTVIGKALEPLDAGTGTIRVLVMLR